MTDIAVALAAVEEHILAGHPDLSIQLIGQVHHIRPSGIAFIDVFGCEDKLRRRAIRAEAVDLLQLLGFDVELYPNHDVFFLVEPDFSNQACLHEWRERLQRN